MPKRQTETVPARELQQGDTIKTYGSGGACGFAGEVVVTAEDDPARSQEVIVTTERGLRIRFGSGQTLAVEHAKGETDAQA